MKEYIRFRVIENADYIIENNATVRQTAKVFNISKSTVHKDVSDRLLKIDRDKSFLVKGILEKNLAERHIRGGNVTKQKYMQAKQNQLKI